MKVSIENNRVFINGKEIKGWKRFMVLFFSYFAVPIFIVVALLIVLALIGVALSVIIPICIGVILLSGIVFIITRLLK